MSKVDNFPYPTPIPAKIWGCSLWNRSVVLGSSESEVVRLISREIIFAEFEHIWSRYFNVTDGRTDRQTDNLPCKGNTALRVASRGKNGKQSRAVGIEPTSPKIFCLTWATRKHAKDCWNGRGNDNLAELPSNILQGTNRKLAYDFLLELCINL